jgi:RimJ/RimL family protein N-acetyltransferase
MDVRIRPLIEQDAYTSVKWRNIPDIWIHTKFKADHEITLENELEWIRKVISEKDSRRFAIMAMDNYVGNIYLTGIRDGTAEYHIFIGEKDFWGKGVARKASELLISHARNDLHLRYIQLLVKEDNRTAIFLYKSLGFTLCGNENEFLKMRLDL